jgi:D-glycero-alpha-D-manno-heptose-7-phosphate kinase
MLTSHDTGRSAEFENLTELRGRADLGLLGRILHFFEAEGLTIDTWADSPAGAGIAGSSALNVAVCAAMDRWRGTKYRGEELLALAQNLECQAIDVPTGVQDYRPALYGGIAAVELTTAAVRHVPLDVDPKELERRITLCYTGMPRNSGTNNWEIVKRHIDGDRATFDLFERIRDTAVTMRRALEGSDWDQVGRQIDAEWQNRKQLAPNVTTAAIDTLMAAARRAVAQGAKVCGAGGGGCFFCYSPPSATPAVRESLAGAGGLVLDFRIETQGLLLSDSRKTADR